MLMERNLFYYTQSNKIIKAKKVLTQCYPLDTFTEEDNINYLSKLNNRIMISIFSGGINFWNLLTKTKQHSIYFTYQLSLPKKCYVIKSINLLIINNVKEIVIINTKTFQIQTVINKEVPDKNIAIVENKFLVICGKYSVQFFCLKTFKIISKMFVNKLNSIVQIQEHRFIFTFDENNKSKIIYFYL